MFKIKLFFVALGFLFPLCNYAQYTDQINSNRPGETQSAFAVGKSVIQVETGVYGIQEKHSLLQSTANGFGLDATIRYGLVFEKLELIANIQYQNEIYKTPYSEKQLHAFKQTNVGLKYLLYDPFKNYKKKINLYSWKANQAFNWHQLLPAVSIFAGANYSFANNPYYFSTKAEISPKVVLITQNHLGDGSWVLITNTIADYIGTQYPSYAYAVTLTKGISKKWSGFIENQGFKSDFYSDLLFRTGAAYLFSNDLQIDASISGSTKNTPSIVYGGIGLSWRYDAMHTGKKIAIDDENTSKTEKKARKKAEKASRKKGN